MRKQILLALACVLLLVSSALAQDTLWTRTYGGSELDYGMFVRQTTDGGFIIIGETESFGAGDRDIYLIKTNPNGDTLWTRTYGGVEREYGYSVELTTDGGYILGGTTWSYGPGAADVYLLKTDSLGDTLWTRTYGGSETELGNYAQQTTDGGYVIVGHTNSYGAGLSDVYLVKTDSLGDTLWTRTYGGSETEAAWHCQQTNDGGYIIPGYTASFGPGTGALYLVKTDSTGDTIWTRTYGGSNSEGGNYVEQTPDGGYIVAGYTGSFGAGGDDFWLLKVDSTGNMQWNRTYGGSGDDIAWPVRQTSDGGYILSGYTNSFGAGDWDVYLVKTDASGDLIWSRTYGGSARDWGWSIDLTSDGGYIVNGFTESFGAGGSDFYVLRVVGEALTLTIVPGDTVVAHNDTLCYQLICQNNTPDYLQLSFKVTVRLPSGGLYRVFGPARFGMFGNGISEGDMCHRVPPPAPAGDYWLFAEVYNSEFSATDSMAFTVTGKAELGAVGSVIEEWQTVVARMGDWDFLGGVAQTGLPTEFALGRNYPNPFNASTVINYQLPITADVKLEVYNLLGEKAATLVDSKEQAGYRSVVWDASEVSSGIYFYKLTAGDFTETKRMILVK